MSDLRKAQQLRIVVCEDNHIHIELRDGVTLENDDGRPYAEFVIRSDETAYGVLALLQVRVNEMMIARGLPAPTIQ